MPVCLKVLVNQIGSPEEVFDRPVNLFVAGFIGMPVMNFFDNCKLLLEDGVYYAQIRSARIKLDDFRQKALKQTAGRFFIFPDRNATALKITLCRFCTPPPS